MPIPDMDSILNVLPPHKGDPTDQADLAPYPCTLVEVCQRFGTSAERKRILVGLLRLRAELRALGIHGFQWLAGSFVENIEDSSRRRPPKDVDVFTVGYESCHAAMTTAMTVRRDLYVPRESKAKYFVDHYMLSLAEDSLFVLDRTQYWYALFHHTRENVWKGTLLVRLGDAEDDDDDAARALGVVL